MQILSRLRHPKRLLSAAGVSALVLALTGCSPGLITANLLGSISRPADAAHIALVCTVETGAAGNCGGRATATVKGTPFRTLTVNGGTADANYNDCVTAPCPASALFSVSGNAVYGTQKATYYLNGRDFDPATATTPDGINLHIAPGPGATFTPFTTTFACSNCVEIVMLPGQTP